MAICQEACTYAKRHLRSWVPVAVGVRYLDLEEVAPGYGRGSVLNAAVFHLFKRFPELIKIFEILTNLS